MSRVVINSHNSIVLAGNTPAYKTSDEIASLIGGVQNVSFGFTQERNKSKHLGSSSLIVNDIIRMPDVDLNIDYLYSPYLVNEEILGVSETNGINNEGFLLSDEGDRNFYIINTKNEYEDGLDLHNSDGTFSTKINNCEIIKFGNAFMTNYSLGFSVGQLPIVSTSYKCSNIETSIINQMQEPSPAINLESGNQVGVGNLNMLYIQNELTDDILGDLDLRSPKVATPSDVFVYLQDLEIGGVPLAGEPSCVQSFSFNIPIDRVDMYGLGSDYVYGRKVKYPLTASLSVDLLVSGYATGKLNEFINGDESYYDFTIAIKTSGEYTDVENMVFQDYHFNNLRLESSQHEMSVNDIAKYSLNFSYEIEKP